MLGDGKVFSVGVFYMGCGKGGRGDLGEGDRVGEMELMGDHAARARATN